MVGAAVERGRVNKGICLGNELIKDTKRQVLITVFIIPFIKAALLVSTVGGLPMNSMQSFYTASNAVFS